MSFKICVIGCGGMSDYVHGPSISKYAKENDSVLAGCCDLDIKKATAYKEKFGFANAYTNYVEMLNNEKPDAVCLIVPVKLTAELAVNIIRMGYPLIMEKPPGMTAEETKMIADASDKYKVLAKVAFNRRYMPYISMAKNAVKENYNGIDNIYYTLIRNKRFDKDFSTTSIHAIDTVRFLADSDYESVHISYQNMPEHGENVSNIFIDGKMKSGCHIRIDLVVAGGCEMERLIINGFDNTISVNLPFAADGNGGFIHMKNRELHKDFVVKETDPIFIKLGFYDENKNFFECVKKGESYLNSDVKGAMQSVLIAELIRNRKTFYSIV